VNVKSSLKTYLFTVLDFNLSVPFIFYPAPVLSILFLFTVCCM